MQNITTAKIFGTGQITLPKAWRDKVKANIFIVEEVSQGLLIKPLVPSLYYETDSQNFGINFPTGIEAGKLAKELKKANERL